MKTPEPVTLEGHGVRLEPLTRDHSDGLIAAAADGKLWELWFTSVPDATHTADYITDALAGSGFRTDNFNFRSQRAIEGLGAKAPESREIAGVSGVESAMNDPSDIGR